MIKPASQSVQSVSVPAPVGGWNSRDPMAAMPATDAVALDNWFPTSSDVRIRPGCSSWATGSDGRVESLMTYASGSTTKLFAAAGNKIFDISSGGAMTSPVAYFSTSRIMSENFTTAAGNYLMCCSGVNTPQHYNGTTWAAASITGVTGGSSTLVQPCAFKSRLFFVQSATMSVWYLAVNSIAGAATEFNLGSIFQSGGYIVAMGSWTLDAGRGVDDHAVFVTSRGEVAVYAGSDPTTASGWALVGVYRIGVPIGRNCLVKYAGDLLIICQNGLFPLSSALQSTGIDASQAVTDKIRSTVSRSTILYGSIFGWQTTIYPKENALIMNVPVTSTESHQYVMNGITGAWCRFIGWDASCFAVYGNDLYFGGTNAVYLAWDGASDNGVEINADAKQAFNDFMAPARKKHFKMAKLNLWTNGGIAPGITLNVDYADEAVTNPGATIPNTVGVWGSSVWGVSMWGGIIRTAGKWQKVKGVGYCASLRVSIETVTSQTGWYSTDYMVDVGGIL